MFDPYRVSVAVMPRESLQGTRASIIQRLRDMNSQIQAIDHMSDNIERGFHGTRMVKMIGPHLCFLGIIHKSIDLLQL